MSLIEGRWILVAAAATAAAAIPWMLLDREEMPVHPPPRPTVTDFAPREFGGLSYALAAPPFSPTRSAGTTPPQDVPPPEPTQAAAPPPPPPILVGIVSGGGRPGVALAKGADGRTETLATGANIGGWRLVRIGRDHAVFDLAGTRHTARLDFSNKPGSGAVATAAPTNPPPEQPSRSETILTAQNQNGNSS